MVGREARGDNSVPSSDQGVDEREKMAPRRLAGHALIIHLSAVDRRESIVSNRSAHGCALPLDAAASLLVPQRATATRGVLADFSAELDTLSTGQRATAPFLAWTYVVETMGLEPTTPCLQSRCSSQLSYAPGAC